MSVMSLVSLVLNLLPFASAVVLPRQGAVTALSQGQITAFQPFTFFASAGYCNPSTTIDWSCGATCDANPEFIPIASGGDGAAIQFWFVGFDTALNTVVVSHEGTDPSRLLPLLTDGDFFLASLDQTMFPGTQNLKVHDGFRDAHASTAADVLAAVQNGLVTYSTTSVTLVGHSLGAAISILDLVFLSLHLPLSTFFKFVGYGLPRVGDPEFAMYLDSNFPDLTHINNKEDPVPTLPGEFLGFQHPHGEVHIQDSGEWDSCAGDDNTSSLCSTGDVYDIFVGNLADHDGPYDGVTMGC